MAEQDPGTGTGDDPTPPVIDLTTLDLGGDVVFITDRDGTIVGVNDAFVRVTGYSRKEAIGATPRLLSSGLQDEDYYRDLWETILAGNVWEGQLVDRHRDGRLRTHHATISPVRDPAGRITHFVAVERDISADLQRHAGRGSTGLLHLDPTGRCVYADPQAAVLFGSTTSTLLGTGVLDRLSDDDADGVREIIGRVMDTARTHRLDVRLVANGQWLGLEVGALSVASGTVVGVTVAVEDVGERIRTHAELDRRDALATSVIDALPEPVAVASAEGVVLLVNRAWREADASRTDPLLGVRVGDDLVAVARRHADDDQAAASFLRELQHLLRGLRGFERDGRDHEPHRFGLSPLAWDEGGAVVRYLG